MMSDLRPYPEYQDSDLPWIGRIPAHWDVRRNGRLFAQRNETGYGSLPILEVSLKTGVRVRDMRDLKRKQVMSDREKYKRAVKGDIAYNMMRMWQGAVGVAPEDGLVSPAYVVARPYPETEPRYFSYLFRTDAYKNEVDGFSRGIVKDRNRLYWEDFKRMSSCFPPLDEQKAIADYLDANAVKVRRFIRNRRRLIDVLNEQRQAIINRAVTRGLDPNAPLRPSGIEWLGDVPEHWVSTKLASRYDQCLGKMVDAKRFTGGHALPYLRNTDVQWDRINTQDLPLIDIAPHERERFTIRHGDLLVCEGGDVGRCAFWRGELEVCGFQKALHRLRPLNCDADCPRFLYYCMYNASKLGVFLADGSENTIAHLTGVKLRAHRFAFPSKGEQQRIADFLDAAVADADRAIGVATREIELIGEYRTRLIADVVIGKIDVRQGSATAATQKMKKRANVHFRRSVFAAEIVHRLHAEPTFGHVKFEKLIFLCEKRCGVDTGSTYYRKAAGPYDNRALRSIDSQIKKQKWYECTKGEKGYRYLPMEKAGGHKDYFDRYFENVATRFDQIIDTFRKLNTQRCEIVATLYAAWEDLLAKGNATDDQIIEQVLHHWHPSKEKIGEDRWRQALGWMKAKGLTPSAHPARGQLPGGHRA